MNSTAKRLYDLQLQQAAAAEAVGLKRQAERHRRCALTYTYPIGEIIAQTYN
jgi:hypothetical protein